MRGVRIIFRNFRGEEGKYNKEGDRNFAVVIDEEMAEILTRDGWPVKKLDPREGYEEDGVTWYLPVAIRFDVFPPRVMLITSTTRTQIHEKNVSQLDWITMTNVDLIVRPHFWDIGGKSGIKAYVKTMYITMEEDPLEAEYGVEEGPIGE